MQRVRAGAATCALCHQPLPPDADAVVTPDFLADETDPFYPFSDAAMHHACFAVWDRRKAFIAHFNRVARRLIGPDGVYVQMSSEGELVRHLGLAPPPGPPT
jgi:hypothetical protein